MELTEDQVNKTLKQLARKMGQKNASNLLSVLGKDKSFLNAIDSPVGQEILKHMVSSIENKIALIIREQDKPEDRAELRVCMEILNQWTATINSYNKNKQVFDRGSAL